MDHTNYIEDISIVDMGTVMYGRYMGNIWYNISLKYPRLYHTIILEEV